MADTVSTAAPRPQNRKRGARPRAVAPTGATKTVRFHEHYLSKAYGFFHRDRVYTNVPADMPLPSKAEEITREEIDELDNVITNKRYDGLYAASAGR